MKNAIWIIICGLYFFFKVYKIGSLDPLPEQASFFGFMVSSSIYLIIHSIAGIVAFYLGYKSWMVLKVKEVN